MKIDRIIINHVPKTGGSTVVTAVTNAVGQWGWHKSKRVQIVEPCQDAREIIDSAPESMRVFSGHYAFRDPTVKRPGELWITTWRDPVAAAFSAWDYYRGARRRRISLEAHDPLHRAQIENIRAADTFEDYLLNAELAHWGQDPRTLPYPVGWEPSECFDWTISCTWMQADLDALGRHVGLKITMPDESSWNKSVWTFDRAKYGERMRAVMNLHIKEPWR